VENHRDLFVENMENHRENCEIFESKIAKTSIFFDVSTVGKLWHHCSICRDHKKLI